LYACHSNLEILTQKFCPCKFRLQNFDEKTRAQKADKSRDKKSGHFLLDKKIINV